MLQVGIAGDHGGLVSDGRHDDDSVDGVGRSCGSARNSRCTTDMLVVQANVAALQRAGDLVLGATSPCLGTCHRRHERTNTGVGQFIMQGKEVRLRRSAASKAPAS
ncbi:hypothetical protein [Microbispora rosea]|uniref:hypothetical protein n=1 Tax=Microbispora rosea TaxID=58117 RepID=UPI0033E22766